MKPFIFEIIKDNLQFQASNSVSPLNPFEKGPVTVMLSEENYDWFQSLGEIAQGGLHGEWKHKGEPEDDFDKWLTKRKTSLGQQTT